MGGFKGLFVAPVVLVALAAGCGGDGASQEELDRAKAEGAKEAKEQAKVDRLQRQVRQLQRQRNRNARSGAGRGDLIPDGPTPISGPARTCTGGVGAGSATSCEFAMNVAGEYGSNPGAATIGAYSPVTGQHYTMSCVAMSGWSAVCTGGDDAIVYIP